MRKTVLTFGLIAGLILSIMMLATLPFMDSIGFDRAEVIGYTTMVAAFLLVFFGIRAYRDNVAGGSVSFGRAFGVGALIVVVAAVCYVATWQVIYHKVAPDFVAKWQAYSIEQARASGEGPAAIEKKAAEMQRMAELYRNPLINVAVTFLEPLPVGLIIAFVSAAVLRRPSRVRSRADKAAVVA